MNSVLGALAIGIVANFVGCGGEGGSGPVEALGEPRWEVPVSKLEGALLSIWGTAGDDIWVVGADARDGTGPLLIHGTNQWERLDLRPVDPLGGHLWWVFGPDADTVWAVGDEGRAFRHDRRTGAWEKVETGTDATLYGVWGASGDTLWAVGGYVFPRTGRPVIVRLTPAGGEVVSELPEGVVESGTFFKVWGTAADDVWVVGERGMALRYDGRAWTKVALEGLPRLVTIHGRSRDDMVVVGGTNQAVILEGDGVGFVDRSPGPYPLLSGVHVATDGSAVAVGMLGQVMARPAQGEPWEAVSGLPVMKDWHAAWRDPRGDLWLVGGNLISAARFDEGLIARFGPARRDGPLGALVGLEPTPSGEDVGDASDVGDTTEVSELGDAQDGSAEDVADSGESGDGADGGGLSDLGPEVADGGTVDGEGPETLSDAGPVDVEVPDGGPHDVADVDPGPDVSGINAFEIGHFEEGTGVFVPIGEGDEVDLVHGPQGGFHVELFVRFDFASGAETLETKVDYTVSVEGSVRASFRSFAYPMARVSEGRYQSYLMTAIFCEDPPPGSCYVPTFDSSLYDGARATVGIVLEPPGVRWERSLSVTLRDTF